MKKTQKLGVIQAKTHTLTFPDFLKEDLIRHFIRGYFDGDGCLTGSYENYKNKEKKYFAWCISIVGTTTFLNKIGEILKNEINVNHCLTTRNKKSQHIQTLDIILKTILTFSTI
jgi:intein/homing endonuclease